jgi:hypothetical protein
MPKGNKEANDDNDGNEEKEAKREVASHYA